MYQFWGEGLHHEDLGPIAAGIVLPDEGFEFEGFELPVARGILAGREELLISNPVFVFPWEEILKGHKTSANVKIATDLDIVVHGQKYLAFLLRTQGWPRRNERLCKHRRKGVFNPLDQKGPFSTSLSYGSCRNIHVG